MGWYVAAGTITGPHHSRRSEPNQDAHAWLVLPGDLAVLAVADGAGSLPRSGDGARRAVRIATDTAATALNALTAGVDGAQLAEHAAAALTAAAADLVADPDSAALGCTLVVAIVSPAAWAVALVGDSFAVLTLPDGTHQLIRPPAAGEYVNITQLLTSRDAEILCAHGDEPLAAVTAATDGLAHPALVGDAAHPGFFTPLVRRAGDADLNVTSLLEHMHCAQRLDDDTTVVVAARTAAHLAP
jgi:hypothetical protein